MKQVNVRIEEEQHKKIKIVCIKKGITFQKAIEEAFTLWLIENSSLQK